MPPAPGITPILISGWPNCADSDATIKSQAIATSQPPPRQKPETAAITGFLRRRMRSQREMLSLRSISTALASAISLMSAPAAKARALPVITLQPTCSSRSKASNAVASSSMTVTLSALSCLGRLIWTRPARPEIDVRIVV